MQIMFKFRIKNRGMLILGRRRKRSSSSRTKDASMRLDITVIALFILSAVLFFLIYSGSGILFHLEH